MEGEDPHSNEEKKLTHTAVEHDVPDAVAVSEALQLVRDLSTDYSPAFVNGVLGSVVRDRESLAG